MATLEQRIISLAQAIGADVKDIRAKAGDLTTLQTSTKLNIVAAINELKASIDSIGGAAAGINDAAGNGDTAVTWSADKIFDTIEAAKQAVRDDLLGGAAAALDTLKELATALGDDPAFAATIAADLAKRVRFDAAQVLTGTERAQARDNIGAAAASDIADLNTALGNLDHDFAADYQTATV
jgi:hypothetical protein